MKQNAVKRCFADVLCSKVGAKGKQGFKFRFDAVRYTQCHKIYTSFDATHIYEIHSRLTKYFLSYAFLQKQVFDCLLMMWRLHCKYFALSCNIHHSLRLLFLVPCGLCYCNIKDVHKHLWSIYTYIVNDLLKLAMQRCNSVHYGGMISMWPWNTSFSHECLTRK